MLVLLLKLEQTILCFNPFLANYVIWHCETFSFATSLRALSLGIRFCASKNRTGGSLEVLKHLHGLFWA